MMRFRHIREMAVLMLLSIALGGCATSGGAASGVPGQARYGRAVTGNTLPSVALRRTTIPQYGLPWYADRNDARPGVLVGVQGPTFDRAITHTIDRQWTSNGHVHDSYWQTTYRQRITSSVR